MKERQEKRGGGEGVGTRTTIESTGEYAGESQEGREDGEIGLLDPGPASCEGLWSIEDGRVISGSGDRLRQGLIDS